MKPTVLILFNRSDYAPRPWLDDGGFNVVSVDYSDTDHSGAHRDTTGDHVRLSIDLSQGDAVYMVQWHLRTMGMAQPSLVVSFAPCTDLAVSGAKHFARKLEQDPQCQDRAVRMAKLASEFGCPYAVENPVSVLATLWRKPNHYWHPCYFAGYCPPGEHPEFPGIIPEQDRYHKKSCLWTGNGFVMPSPSFLAPLEGANPGWEKLGGKSARTKYIRSLTPRGFAQAVYVANRDNIMSQWGLQTMLDAPTMPTGQLELNV